MEQVRSDYEKPFAHAEEIKEKKARLDELNAQLSLENGEEMDLNIPDVEAVEVRADISYKKMAR